MSVPPRFVSYEGLVFDMEAAYFGSPLETLFALEEAGVGR